MMTYKFKAIETDIVLIEKLTTRTLAVRCENRNNRSFQVLWTVVPMTVISPVIMITASLFMGVMKSAVRTTRRMRMKPKKISVVKRRPKVH
jgi:hypothetical protein